jgi:glycosyltransferase involved in cell wall biosynthesis
MRSVCLVSRELYPFGGAGIGVQVAGTLRALAGSFELTVVTTADHRDAYERAQADLPTWLRECRIAFVEEPSERGEYYTYMHAYSARVYELLRQLYPRRAPDLIEFPDYLAEGLVTVQARRASDRWLRGSIVATRIYTTAELCAVLDGYLPSDFETTALVESERYCLRNADVLLWPGGDVLGAYRRYYRTRNLAEPFQLRHALPDADAFTKGPPPEPGDRPLRFLYLGRLERRKGVEDLVEAFLSLVEPRWELTIVGRDTETGPLGTSLRQQLEIYAAGDPRIQFLEGVKRSELPALIARHDALVCPSLWENWPTVVLEGFAANRPVLATPVGGLVEMARTEGAGWLARTTGAAALADVAEELVRDPTLVQRVIEERRPHRAFERLAAAELVARGYQDLLRERRAAARSALHPTALGGLAPVGSRKSGARGENGRSRAVTPSVGASAARTAPARSPATPSHWSRS